MRTALSLPFDRGTELPDHLDGGDVRMPPALAERLLRDHTATGDSVLDPFAGFGTTLVVAEGLGRPAWGVEYEAARVDFAQDRLSNPGRLYRGSVADLPETLPTVECVLTSPPYMHESDDRNPLRNYAGDSDYETYLDDLQQVFRGVIERLAPGGILLVEAANLKHDGHITTFAWDLADTLRDLPGLGFAGERAVSWAGEAAENGVYGFGYDHSYVLVFEYRNER